MFEKEKKSQLQICKKMNVSSISLISTNHEDISVFVSFILPFSIKSFSPSHRCLKVFQINFTIRNVKSFLINFCDAKLSGNVCMLRMYLHLPIFEKNNGKKNNIIAKLIKVYSSS